MKHSPTIKGIFVMSHVRALVEKRGEKGVTELVRRMGKRVRYAPTEDVPVREEVLIIEHVLDILSDTPIPPQKRETEAGKLHFKNFSETPLGGVILSMFGFKNSLLKAQWIAERVFSGIEFIPEELDASTVRIIMKNNDYPIHHFKGFFEAWLAYGSLQGTVEALDMAEDGYQYVISW